MRAIHGHFPLLHQLLPTVAVSSAYVALVREIEIGAGNEAAATGDANDTTRSVAQ